MLSEDQQGNLFAAVFPPLVAQEDAVQKHPKPNSSFFIVLYF